MRYAALLEKSQGVCVAGVCVAVDWEGDVGLEGGAKGRGGGGKEMQPTGRGRVRDFG